MLPPEHARIHSVHCLVLLLINAEAGEMYDKVREGYNRVRPELTTPLPPMEEWPGMTAICDTVFCRYLIGTVPASAGWLFPVQLAGLRIEFVVVVAVLTMYPQVLILSLPCWVIHQFWSTFSLDPPDHHGVLFLARVHLPTVSRFPPLGATLISPLRLHFPCLGKGSQHAR